jgi:leucyl aminopeptidase
MRIDWNVASISDWKGEAILFFAFEKAPAVFPALERWMAQQGSWLSEPLALKDFQGKFQQVAVYYGPSDQPISRVICVGLGPADKFEADKLRKAAASGLRKCRDLQLSHIAIPLSIFEDLPMDTTAALEEMLIGGLGGLYRYQGLKTRETDSSEYPNTLTVFAETEPNRDLRGVAAYAEAVVSGIYLTRDLVSAPPNQATPGFLAEAARQLAERHGFLLQVISFEQARDMGMGAFAAVAQGSLEPAGFIVLEHAPSGTEKDRPLVFIGKGITFDTGGISLKPAKDMDAMKHDMAGAAAVLGVFEVIGKTKPQRRVIGLLPCTENMPDGKAYKPADVIRTLSGLTVEVISTDAEGRMVLSDALAYAKRYRPALMVDIATLTGACIIALGKDVAAIMGNREALIPKIQQIGMQVGEKLWQLPLWDFYFDYIKSDVADFKNVGERAAGTIIGGIFLKQFVPEEIPWVHLDIASTAWTEKDWFTAPRGATGFGVRLMAELIRRWPELEME